jgi:hypothetical protein
MIEFKAWPKIARLNRDIVITEKLDGTNAAVIVDEYPFGTHAGGNAPEEGVAVLVLGPNRVEHDGLPAVEYVVGAQSRNRLITPEKDNAGFASWVWHNAGQLASILGPGHHFGEWWGSGIQRNYGVTGGKKFFSLFNTAKWAPLQDSNLWGEIGMEVVPILYEGPFSEEAVKACVDELRLWGSNAMPFMNPEGVVIYHKASGQMFKVTLEGDEAPKSSVALAA